MGASDSEQRPKAHLLTLSFCVLVWSSFSSGHKRLVNWFGLLLQVWSCFYLSTLLFFPGFVLLSVNVPKGEPFISRSCGQLSPAEAPLNRNPEGFETCSRLVL